MRPTEEAEGEGEGDEHPGELDLDIAAFAMGTVGGAAGAVAEREIGDGDEDGHGEQERDGGEGEDEVIHLGCGEGGRGGPQGDQERKPSFLKKSRARLARGKKLLPLHRLHDTGQAPYRRSSGESKVFWFFSSERNMLPLMAHPNPCQP